MASEMTTIGKVVSPFGIKGEVKVYPYSDFLERCFLLKKVKLEGESFSGFKIVKNSFIHKNMWVLHFEDCHSRDDAQKLIGLDVKILPSERVQLPPGEYYLDQIVGLEALTVKGERIGVVKRVIKTGSNDVYVVKGDREILLPALKTVVKEINLEKGYILVDLPPGLVD